MNVPRGVSEPEDARAGSKAAFYDLLGDKAWQHLGLTVEEFKRRWYAGDFRHDTRPAALALDAFMRTGEWQVPEPG